MEVNCYCVVKMCYLFFVISFITLLNIELSLEMTAQRRHEQTETLSIAKIGFLHKLGLDSVPSLSGDEEWIPNYLKTLYDIVERIPGHYKFNDLTVYAIKPVKLQPSSARDKLQYQYQWSDAMMKAPLGQIEIVFDITTEKNILQTEIEVVVNICWGRHLCYNTVALFKPQDNYSIADISVAVKTSKDMYHPITVSGRVMTVSLEFENNTEIPGAISASPVLFVHTTAKEEYQRKAIGNGIYDTEAKQQSHSKNNRRTVKWQKRSLLDHSEENVRLDESNYCRLYRWEISVEDLGWSEWIIQPKIFATNICSGECITDQATKKVNISSHAFLRQLYYELHDGSPPPLLNSVPIPKPLCVPIKTSPVNTLFKEEDDTLTLKRMDEITATACGCL